jgi:two-component system chemotaxis sensor kinase CheA
MNEPQIGQFKKMLEQLAAEVVFAEPGKDNGLLPINNLLGQIEELFTASAAPEPVAKAVRAGRRWVDEIFDTSGQFSGPAIGRFHQWVEWLQSAVRALEQKTPPPGLPSHWDSAGQSPAPDRRTDTAPPADATPAAPAEPTLTLNAGSDAELLREFINESSEHLQNIEQGVLALEENPKDADTLNTIFRAFHSFKGGSGFLNLAPIQSLAHELESLLDRVRQRRLAITPTVINLVLDGGDTLKQFIAEIDLQLSGKNPAPILVPTLQLLARVRAVLHGEAARPAAVPTPMPAPNPGAAPSPVVPPATPAPMPPSGSEPVRAESNHAAKTSASASSVKVDTFKLDSLVDLVGELVIGQSLVVQSQALLAVQDQQFTRDLAQLGRTTRELQRTAMSLRMLPIRSTFQKMNRLVRDTSARLGKQVELIVDGEETELDRTIVEEISDPLIHMIRNAIDHGIEMPSVRQQRGKPAQGTISLKAFYQGGNIVIEIKDDGNGLDRARILAKAVEKGIARPDAALSESEIFNLIFTAGFSLAEKVSDLSGRGVGLDVVHRNIEKLRGKVEIQSTLGQGSTFSIFLPLTLAIIDGLIVGVGEQRYILPTLKVCEAFRPTSAMLSSVQERGEMINVRGRLRPLLRLYEHLGVKPASTDPTQSIAVVVEAGKDARCVLVDRLLGKQEVVIKSLGQVCKEHGVFSGAAILGDGGIGLILDPQAFD